jgi:ureidoacrylate peracid hydrolase
MRSVMGLLSVQGFSSVDRGVDANSPRSRTGTFGCGGRAHSVDDMTSFEIDPGRTAVVVVDMLNWQVPKDVPPGAYWNQYFVDRCWELVVPAHQRLLPAAREAGATIVYLQVGGADTECSDVIRPFKNYFRDAGAVVGRWECEVIPELAPESDDVVLPKRGSGGFSTSGLDAALKERGVDTAIYTGVVTHACVLLTATAGFDHEYTGYLAGDATATFSDELQAATELAIGGMVATVTSTDDLIEALRIGAARPGARAR